MLPPGVYATPLTSAGLPAASSTPLVLKVVTGGTAALTENVSVTGRCTRVPAGSVREPMVPVPAFVMPALVLGVAAAMRVGSLIATVRLRAAERVGSTRKLSPTASGPLAVIVSPSISCVCGAGGAGSGGGSDA